MFWIAVRLSCTILGSCVELMMEKLDLVRIDCWEFPAMNNLP